MVQAGGSGTYTVANIQRTLGTNQWAGWSLIVVYGDNAATLKNLTVFDGFQVDPVSTTVSGFLTPLSGPITTRLGFVGYDGDRDSTSAGEAFTINGVPIVDGQNPSLNFYNSTISNLGSPFTARNPNYANTLGLDIDLVASPAGALGNGATSATITLGAATEEIWIHAVAFATDIYVPIITPNVVKTATDVNGGSLNRGDVLRFNISMSNTGQDTGTNVILTDNIPANTTYVPGTLVVTSGANAGAKSDTSGNDQAEFLTGPNRVVFRLGTGANAVSGGNLANGQSTAVQFDVTIDAATPPGAQISNTASISYSGQTLGASFGTTSAAANATVMGPPTIAKSFAPNAIANGGTSVLTIQVANPAANPSNLTGVTFTDTYPGEPREHRRAEPEHHVYRGLHRGHGDRGSGRQQRRPLAGRHRRPGRIVHGHGERDLDHRRRVQQRDRRGGLDQRRRRDDRERHALRGQAQHREGDRAGDHPLRRHGHGHAHGPEPDGDGAHERRLHRHAGGHDGGRHARDHQYLRRHVLGAGAGHRHQPVRRRARRGRQLHHHFRRHQQHDRDPDQHLERRHLDADRARGQPEQHGHAYRDRRSGDHEVVQCGEHQRERAGAAHDHRHQPESHDDHHRRRVHRHLSGSGRRRGGGADAQRHARQPHAQLHRGIDGHRHRRRWTTASPWASARARWRPTAAARSR